MFNFSKYCFFCVLLLMYSLSIFGQSMGENILAYFPVNTGNTWNYTNGNGKLNTTVFVQGSENSDIPLYLFVERDNISGQTSTMYGIENNKIVRVAVKSEFRYREERRPFPIELAPINQNWRQNEEGEYYLFKTIKTTVKYDDKVFNDCILVEKQVFVNSKFLLTTRTYYARDIGLVYKTTQGEGKSESVFQKLISCNFVDIKNINANNQLSQFKEDLSNTDIFFFSKLAEVGINNFALYYKNTVMENKVNELSNKTQKTIFDVLCKITIYNMSAIYDMFSSGSVNISTYLNTPIPDDLITIHLDNKSLATAIDKAIKIIVISSIFNLSQEKLKKAISDQKYLEGTRIAEPLFSNLYKVDSSINSNDYNSIVEPLYRLCMDTYFRHGGK